MTGVLNSPEVSKRRGEKTETLRLARAIKDRSTTQLQPEPEAKQTVKLEFPYDDLYLMYDYIIKELGIKNPFNW